MADDEGSWGEYRRLLLSELERLSLAVKGLDIKIDSLRNDELSTMRLEIATLKERARMGGAIAGLLGAAAIELIARFVK